MSVSVLLKAAAADTVGPEVAMRVIGSAQAPERMVLQVAVNGTATVQIQGRIAREAPWQNLGAAFSGSTLFHIDAVQFLRAVATGVAEKSTVSAWAVWAW
jgi:hypothetical protein